MSTTTHVAVLNAPTISGDVANVTYRVIDSGGTTRIAATNTGLAALDAGYVATFTYDDSWPDARIDWLYQGVQVASDTFSNSSGGGIDPWAISQPGSYGGSTFGYLVSHTLPRLNGSNLTITVNMLTPDQAGTFTIVRGDGYYDSDNTGFSVPCSSILAVDQGTWKMRIFNTATEDNGLYEEIDVSISGSSGNWTLKCDIIETLTAGLTPNEHAWEISGTLASGHHRTLVQGIINVVDRHVG